MDWAHFWTCWQIATYRQQDLPEISDLIVQFDWQTGARLPVRQAEVVQRFLDLDSKQAARIVANIPSQDGLH
jgi:hypothetical protein